MIDRTQLEEDRSVAALWQAVCVLVIVVGSVSTGAAVAAHEWPSVAVGVAVLAIMGGLCAVHHVRYRHATAALTVLDDIEGG